MLNTARTHQNDSSRRNANQWHHVADFLVNQFVASLALAAGGQAEGATVAGPREAHPVGNTGITSEVAK
jgi:hypothetical protein